MCTRNRTMGIPALEDGLFANMLILDYLYIYIYLYIFGSACGGDCCGGCGGARINAFRALPPGRHENRSLYTALPGGAAPGPAAKSFITLPPGEPQKSWLSESVCTGRLGPRSNLEPICVPSKNPVFKDSTNLCTENTKEYMFSLMIFSYLGRQASSKADVLYLVLQCGWEIRVCGCMYS